MDQVGDLQRGTPTFRRVNLALFAGAIATYASLYTTQPLLPMLSESFHVTPAMASLTVSSATICLAAAMVVGGPLSDSLGRKAVMTVALVATGVTGVLAAFAPTFGSLLVLRALGGLVLAGLPATAMAYLAEEIDPRYLGVTMGLYISGNSVGGMAGRIVSGIVADVWNWRAAVGAIGLISLACSLLFWRTLPPSRHFKPQPLSPRRLVSSLLQCLRDPGLRLLYGTAFLIMGSFVTLFNYISYHLIAEPYHLSHTLLSWIFLLYLVGTFSSTWMGRISDRYGRRQVLWISIGIQLAGALTTLFIPLALKVLGIGIFTFGFFAAHSIASGWVGERAATNKGAASSLYLFFYYLGSSVAGTGGGMLWLNFGWGGVVAFIAVFLALGLVTAGLLSRLTAARDAVGTV
jgi:MFS transporter, YNFM family, putative membrane transport protein